MLRTALRPRWLGLLGVVVLVVVAFVQLGRWQLGVAQDTALKEALEAARHRPVVDLTTVLRPHQPFPGRESARRVRVSGHYGPGQVLVADRRLGGRAGWWVVTPLVVDGSGATVAVLRGFVTAPAAPVPPTGDVRVVGGLAPGESPYRGPALPDGQLGTVDVSILVNTWPGEIYNGFVFLEQETTATGAPVARPPTLATVPTPTVSTGLNWRNAAYALQWWVFAAFALGMWVRMVRRAHEEATAEPSEVLPDPPQVAPSHAGDNGARD